MDPDSVDPSLQKTSPNIDPAAVYRLTTEVSAQANILAAHQQQLAQLTTLTEEMVKTLHSLHLPSPQTAQPPLASASQPALLTPPVASPHLAYTQHLLCTDPACLTLLLINAANGSRLC
ncbi:hypothetical protein M9458_054316 [Cirrhinus mrigala]|uniref:Uncharacterized protein n=1 Tax=Cirrhinus mrigala TaxID=683832 RepID=A0ABD0MKU1_CIRMR